MKPVIFLLCLAMLVVPSAFATGLCTDNIGEDVLVPGFYCTLGPLLFQNFSASAGGLGYTPHVWIGSGVTGNLTGYSDLHANIYFNNNFNDNVTIARDISFNFDVVGFVNGVDAWTGGLGNTTFTERVADGADNTLATIILYTFAHPPALPADHTSQTVMIPLTRNISVDKDINISAFAGTSHFSQSFYTIPEPLTLVLVGSGLLGLGLLRRRLRG